MSHVTNLLLSFDIMEDEKARADDFNSWLAGTQGQQLVATWNVEGAYGGSKYMEQPLYAAAFNYLNLDDFLRELRRIEWKHSENVRVMVCEQDDDAYRMIELGGDPE